MIDKCIVCDKEKPDHDYGGMPICSGCFEEIGIEKVNKIYLDWSKENKVEMNDQRNIH